MDQDFLKARISQEQEVIIAHRDVDGEPFATRFCIRCGKKIRADSHKCAHCGFMPR